MSKLSRLSEKNCYFVAPPKVVFFSKDADTRFLFFTVLTAMNYLVLEAESIPDAVETIQNFNPHLVLLDIRDPFEEDLSAMSELLKEKGFDRIPVVSLSAYPEAKYPELTGSIDICQHLTKPVDFDHLEDCLTEKINIYRESLYLEYQCNKMNSVTRELRRAAG
jgi:CheY-like chemotaxis protein